MNHRYDDKKSLPVFDLSYRQVGSSGMEDFKIYDAVSPDDQSMTFNIKRMEDIYAQTKGMPDTPHRHEYFTIVFPISAKGQHIIDFHEFQLSNDQVFFVAPGQVHQIIERSPSIGYAITFSRSFMAENQIDDCFIDDLHLFQDYGYSPPLILEEDERLELSVLCEKMIHTLHSNIKFKYPSIGAQLKLFLIACNNACSMDSEDHTQNIQASVSLLRSFKSELNTHYVTHHKVQDYAKLMHITPDYLNASIKGLTGKTAKDQIQAKIIIEAKRLLKFTDLTTKEIAYRLGFSEAANFSLFFKKRVGKSPTAFMKSM